MPKPFANSEDADQRPRSAASDLGLYCLPITHLGVFRLQWVNAKSYFLSKIIIKTLEFCLNER